MFANHVEYLISFMKLTFLKLFDFLVNNYSHFLSYFDFLYDWIDGGV